MKTRSVYLCFILILVMALSLMPSFANASAALDKLGNSDLNILNGGVMLTDGDDLYFNHSGIFVERGEKVTALSADDGKNLNLVDGWLYYTLGDSVYRIPSGGGAREKVHTASGEIKQLYVIGAELRYVAEGRAFSANLGGKAASISSIAGVMGLIPTAYGNLFLTGEVQSYTLWAENAAILFDVQSCYTDSGYLAVQIGNENYMAPLEGLFKGFRASSLEDFSLHGSISIMSLLASPEADDVSDNNDNNKLQMDFDALLEAAGFEPTAKVSGFSGASLYAEVAELSEGQRNIVKRARQLHEIEWTPLENRAKWGEDGVFYAETTYKGIPYGQPVNSGGYVGYSVTLDQFATAVLDNTSKFYITYSTYNKIAPVYSTDCSAFVSYAWGHPQRKTTYSIPEIAEKVGDQSVYSLQVGDCLNRMTSHVVLVSGITYDAEGNIIGVEIMEQTPPITKLTRYGAGESKSLASLQSYYFNGGYVIYRYPNRDGVTYTASAAVPLDGEIAPGQKDKAPKSTTTAFVGGKSVALHSDHAGATIHYTLDGSAPTAASPQYTTPISVYETTKLRAIAVTGVHAGSTILEYTVKVPQLDAPKIAVSDGLSAGEFISAGSKVSISSVSGATIHYTTDGSTPTEASKVYSAPIVVSSDITIKAMAVAKGYKASAAATMSYKLGAVYTVTATAGNNGTVSPAGNKSVVQTGSVTYTITPKAGFSVNEVLVDGVNVGTPASYTFSNVSANHTISASFKSNANIPFTDVSKEQWFYDAVTFAYANSLFNGVTATTFEPDMAMTRGMFITVLGRFAGVPSSLEGSTIGVVTGEGVNIRSGPSTDTDVAGTVAKRYTTVAVLGKSGDWYQIKHGGVTGYIRGDFIKAYGGAYTDLGLDKYYAPYAQWAQLSGVADGVAGNVFDGEADITREDMCLLLHNFAQKYGKALPAAVEKEAFADEHQMGSGAVNAIYALQKAGVINGMGGGVFSPKGTATRAQVAQIYNKFVNAVD